MIVKEIKHLVGSQLLFLKRNSCDVLLRGPIYLGIDMTLTISCGYERNIFKVPFDSHKLTLRKRKFRGNKLAFKSRTINSLVLHFIHYGFLKYSHYRIAQ